MIQAILNSSQENGKKLCSILKTPFKNCEPFTKYITKKLMEEEQMMPKTQSWSCIYILCWSTVKMTQQVVYVYILKMK